MWKRLRARSGAWDMLIIGGGATGAGIAVDAASRGYSVLLLEQHDFGKGTSSRSTKLVHGGVRYLEQGNISLVMEALKERGLLLENAPHLVHDLPFVVPNYDWWETPFYGLGLKVYNLLAGKYGFGKSRILSKDETLQRLPTIRRQGLRGGVMYYDGQFDDSRLLIHLVRTAYDLGATLLNYVRVTGFTRNAEGFLDGAVATDMETGEEIRVSAKVVINATGAYADELRKMADSGVAPLIAPSQGIHLVFDRSFVPGDSAIMVPHTSDGRVMFAIPWHNHVVVGTTDTPIQESALEPAPFDQEIDFILDTAGLYLAKKPTRTDVLSVFTGIRPLVRSSEAASTAALSRDHTIQIEKSGLLTICGGKWTTYRRMAQDCVDYAATLASLPDQPCMTHHLPVHGATKSPAPGHLRVYGTDAHDIGLLQQEDARFGERLHAALPYTAAEVVWSARQEMARTVEDVLARRLRALFLNSRAAVEMAPRVASLLASELGHNDSWEKEQIREFEVLAVNYSVQGSVSQTKGK